MGPFDDKMPTMRFATISSVLALLLAASCHSKPAEPIGPKGPVDMPKETVTVGGAVGTPPPSADPDAQPLPLDPEIKRGVLPNGLTYYVMKHQKPETRASLWLAVNAGAVLEDDDQNGLAHFCEHMAFNGTKRFPKSEIVDFIEKSGMNFGADLNAYTNQDETVYQLTVPTDNQATLGKGIDILRDWAGDVTYDPAEVDKERGVVLEEWRLGRGAFARIWDKQSHVLFAGSKYAERNVIGKPEILKTAPRDTLYRFYKQWYQPQNMAVIAVGDFDAADIEKQIVAKFGDLKNTGAASKRPAIATPHDHPTLVTIETDKEMPYTQVQVTDKLDRRFTTSKRDFRRFVVESLYHGMMNARFEELAEDPDAPFVYAGSGTSVLTRTADSFNRFAQAKEGKVAETVTALFQEIARVEKFGFAKTELDRAIKKYVARTESEVAEWDKRPSPEMVDEILRYQLLGEEMYGRPNELPLIRALIPTITLDEINHLAKTWGDDKGRVIQISAPASTKLPTSDEVLKLVAAAQAAPVQAWQDEGGDKPLIKPDAMPKPGKVVKTAHDDGTDATTWTLANGVRVIVKPTTFQNDEIVFTGSEKGGSSVLSDADWQTSRFASGIVNAMGAGDFGPVELHKILSDKVVSVDTGVWELSETVNGQTRPADLETALQLAYLKMTAPHKDLKAFAAWKAEQHEDLRNKQLSPERAFFEELGVLTSSNHVRRRPETDAMIDKLDVDKAIDIYKKRFGDLGDMTFVFVGNIDLAKLQPLVETYLGGLPSKGRKEKWKDVGVQFPAGKVEKTFVHGTEPKSFVSLAMVAPEKWSLDTSRDAEILSMVLNIRLREVLREDMGGVYGVQVWAGLERTPKQQRQFQVFFGCDPAKVDALKQAVFEVVAAIQKDGTTADNLAKVTETLRRTRETNLKTNGWWMQQLAGAAYWNEDLRKTTDLDATLARVTNDRVKASAKKFFDPGHYVFAVMKPEAAKK